MHEVGIIEFEDGETEYYTIDPGDQTILHDSETQVTTYKYNDYEEWEHHVAAKRSARFRWQQTPNCLDIDMFPSRVSRQIELAESVCVGCPVQLECLYLGLAGREDYGVWGGSTEPERGSMIDKLMSSTDNFAKRWRPTHEDLIRDTAAQFIKSHNAHHVTASV